MRRGDIKKPVRTRGGEVKPDIIEPCMYNDTQPRPDLFLNVAVLCPPQKFMKRLAWHA